METYTEYFVPVTVTAYSARACECDATPEVTASGVLSHTGIVALSRDLLAEFGVRVHDTIILYVEGERYGTFQVEDKMHKRKHRQVDILMGNTKAAKMFGKHDGVMTWVRAQG